jgi:prevent-host-death family protein
VGQSGVGAGLVLELKLIGIANYMTHTMAMKVANIAQFKNRISEYLGAVEGGEEVEVRKRNVPIARVIPIKKPRIIATARLLQCPIVTADRRMREYAHVQVLW